jgi:trimeric autotransporter adhesin
MPIASNQVALLASFASQAYNASGPSLPSGWQLLAPASSGALSGFTYSNGYFEIPTVGPFGALSIFVAYNSLADQIVISIRGTDVPADDIASYPALVGLIGDLTSVVAPLIDAVHSFASSQGADVYLTGHSLGGGLAEALANANPSAYAGGAFFGSPGSLDFNAGSLSSNFVHITRDFDGVGTLLENDHAAASIAIQDDNFIGADYLDQYFAGHSDALYALQLSIIGASGVLPVFGAGSHLIHWLADDDTTSSFADTQGFLATFGGGGNDNFNASTGSNYVRFDGGLGSDIIVGTSFADFLGGSAGIDSLSGGGGDDTLFGGSNVDYLEGGDGDDILVGGTNGDYYSVGLGQGSDTISDAGNAGALDTIRFYSGGAFSVIDFSWFSVAPNGADLLVRAYDGLGALVLDLTIQDMGSNAGSIELFNLYAGDGATLTQSWDLANVWAQLAQPAPPPPPTSVPPPPPPPSTPSETEIVLTGGDDSWSGVSASEEVWALAGSDNVTTGQGNDTVWGGDGSDTLSGGDGVDVLIGDDNATQEGNDHLNGDAGDDLLSGEAGNDSLVGAVGNDTLLGGAGDDHIDAGDGVDWVDGGAGSDTAYVNLSAETDDMTFLASLAASATGFTFQNGDHVRNMEAVVLTLGEGDDTVFLDVATRDYSYTFTGGAGFDRLIFDATGAVEIVSMVPMFNWIGIGLAGSTHFIGFSGFEAYTAYGAPGQDSFHGGAFDDHFWGNAGADSLIGYGGEDELFGGDGDDWLQPGAGIDMVDGGAGRDQLSYRESSDAVIVDLLAHTASGGDAEGDVFISIERLEGSDFSDVLYGDDAQNVVHGRDGDDTLYGRGGSDLLTGDLFPSDVGDDYLDGGAGADTLQGGAGNDTLDGGTGADGMAGGSDDDTYVVDNVGDVVTEGASEGTDTALSAISYALVANVENLILIGSDNVNGTGNELNNTITGNAAANALDGGDGNDTLNGGLGVDTLNGGAGNDTFLYAIGDGNGSMNGGDGTDTLYVTDGAAAGILNATWNGASLTVLSGNALTSIETITADLGDGVDWLVYAAGSAAVTVNLATNAASGFFSISNIERVVGGNANDVLSGNGLDNRLDGGAGDDTLVGGGGIDTLIGGDGGDVLSGGLSNDSIQAGAGNDAISWSVGDGRDTVDGGADSDTFNATGTANAQLGNATWNGAALTALMDNGLTNIEAINLDLGGGVDWLIYNATAAVVVNLQLGTASGFTSVANIEKVIGGSGDDTLTGNGLDNRLDGQGGADTLDGGAGSDAVLGGDGADVIYASAGNDALQGQNGADTFIWTAADGRDTFNGGADTDTVNLTGSAVADVADANWNGSTITGLLNNALVDIETVNLDLGDGGAGGDWLRYNTSSGVSVDLGAGTATGFASITGVENLIGGTGADSLIGDGGVNKINGNIGDDVITGGAGNDNLTGGAGSDTFVYAAGCGNDTINDFDAWAVGGQDFLDVSAFGINAGNFAARVAIIDTGADTVVRIDNTYFITLKNVTGDGDNSISDTDFIFGP